MKREKQQKKIRKWNNRGITLVELVVTFALISLFTLATCQIAVRAIGVYQQFRAVQTGNQVAELLLEKIEGVLSGAQAVSSVGSGQMALTIAEDGTAVELTDRDWNRVVVTAGALPDRKRGLILHYGGNGDAGEDWYFDSEAYQGYEVTTFSITQAGDGYPDNVLRVAMTLEQKNYGCFQTERYVDCYNFEKTDARIGMGVLTGTGK